MIEAKVIKDHGLTREEYDQIVELIGRHPNLTELGIFSLMWSEHCSYKSSRVHLKKLPVTGENVIQGPGENAGIIDIGDGLAAVFKIESHNHPSFIEPYQGAATGVGGILRDIFTMGARPIASLNSLRFGPLETAQNRAIMDGVVGGIAGYGNSIGVPTVGGEIYFNECYSLNPLVNAFCIGIAEKEKIFYARAEGKDNAVLYVGSKTGRDGIHGATMASAEFNEDLEEKRPNVQVGDPFKEKLLLEACLEIMDKGIIIGIQDMGAAGLTCSTTEMASNAGSGIEIDLNLVPQREAGMTPYEIMLSESQERMLLVAENDKVEEVKQAFAKWDLDAVVIGKVTDTGKLKVNTGATTVVDVPVDAVVNLCPVYKRESSAPLVPGVPLELNQIPQPEDIEHTFLELLASPTIADKEWVFRQYDHMVQTNTAFLPGADAALLRIKGQSRALAVSLDGNPLYPLLDPRTGGATAVAEACRNLACVGARPVGVTNCLNFGNPEKPEIMWQFQEVIHGITEACECFNIPVTGGNVSFYNDTEGVSIHPTPVLGIVGLLDDIEKAVSPGFKQADQTLIMLGKSREELGATEYLKRIHGLEKGLPPKMNLDQEKNVQELCREAIELRLVQSAHDLSEGGLAVSAAECCFYSTAGIGCVLNLDNDMRTDALLFGESQSRILLSTSGENGKKILALAKDQNVPAEIIGKTGGDKIIIRHNNSSVCDLPVKKAFQIWKKAIPDYFNRT